MSSVVGAQIAKSTRQRLEKFNKLRGTEVVRGQFWDVVVVTAADEGQKVSYEMQIEAKLQKKELPLIVHYHVFADPPGAKIGNGGSTLYALQQLADQYGHKLSGFKIILIHAGGFSQRLPSASALGKIFTALPLGDPVYQMLDLKLAIYIDFPPHMNPGVLVTCADDIELYSVADTEHVVFDKPGFTALAHPSPLDIGTTHGVFVLEPSGQSKTSGMLQYRLCRRFLHKPSVGEMHETGAVSRYPLGNGTMKEAEIVYTDSMYYIDYPTVEFLIKVLHDIGPLNCEIDAYGDFLQALGPGATSTYIQNTANVAKAEGDLLKVRQKIFQHLKGRPLNVILLNNSKFYHIGTTREYLFHFAEDRALKSELGLTSSACSIAPDELNGDEVCLIHSVLRAGCVVGSGTVVEYSRLGTNVVVGNSSIISGCQIDDSLRLPDGVFMHSLTVTRNSSTSFVTIAFGIDDDLKKSVKSLEELGQLRLFGTSLLSCLDLWDTSTEELSFSATDSGLSLWNARIFPACPDRRSSFELALKMVCSLLSTTMFTLPEGTTRLSIQESLQCKDLKEMLRFRYQLCEDTTLKMCDDTLGRCTKAS